MRKRCSPFLADAGWDEGRVSSTTCAQRTLNTSLLTSIPTTNQVFNKTQSKGLPDVGPLDFSNFWAVEVLPCRPGKDWPNTEMLLQIPDKQLYQEKDGEGGLWLPHPSCLTWVHLMAFSRHSYSTSMKQGKPPETMLRSASNQNWGNS